MESAKAAVKGFMNNKGKHDTSVHEEMNPAVTNERVDTHRHENVTTAVDKEVHQDHYHTTVQPVHDKEVLPEKHHHNLVGVEHRNYEHGNDRDVTQRLEQERAQFKDSTVRGDTKHTHSVAPTVAGEHVHHHVHEKIQPVVHKQTVEPHVVHTTVSVHEKHHNAAQHHSATSLPPVSMSDFKKQGGALGGREHRHDFFEGEPRNMHAHAPENLDGASSEFRTTGHTHMRGQEHGSGGVTGTTGTTGHNTSSTGTTGLTGHNTSSTGTTGLTGHNTSSAGTTGLTGHNTSSTGTTGLTGHNTSSTGTTGLTGHNTSSTGTTGLRDSTTAGATGTTGHSRIDSVGNQDDVTHKKPSLLDRINPMKDTDGDGKKGIMD